MFEGLYEQELNEFDMVVNPFLNSNLCLLAEDNYPGYLKVNSKVIDDNIESKIEDERNHSYTKYISGKEITEYTSEIFLDNMSLKCSHKLHGNDDILTIRYVKICNNDIKTAYLAYNKTTNKFYTKGNIKKIFGTTLSEKKNFTLHALEAIISSTKEITLDNLQDDGYSKIQCVSDR